MIFKSMSLWKVREEIKADVLTLNQVHIDIISSLVINQCRVSEGLSCFSVTMVTRHINVERYVPRPATLIIAGFGVSLSLNIDSMITMAFLWLNTFYNY